MASFIEGNQVQLLHSGAEYFPALEHAIEHAQHEIYLQTYIYKDDAIGLKIGDALKRAAERGVAVYLLLDGFGCKDLSKSFVKDLKKSHVKLLFYRPRISPWTLEVSRLRRMHRKVAVIDKQLAFIGGINIEDDYTPYLELPRLDYAVCVRGAVVDFIEHDIKKYWKLRAWREWQNVLQPQHNAAHAEALQDAGSLRKVAFVTRDNFLHRRDIETAYLAAIKQAKSEIIIANAYFVPSRRFRRALLDAAKRGVKVKLLLQGRKEYFLMFASHVFYSVFLQHGVEIYEYQKSYMHSKVAVIDSHWATVGSSNLDPFSLLLAREANVIVLDHAFAAELRVDILRTIDECAQAVSSKEWLHGHLLTRFVAWFLYGLICISLSIIGYSNER